MALSTTSSIWRSTGGDQTRTAVAGTAELVAPFYIANAAATGNVVVSSGYYNTSPLILPANAVVTSVTITSVGTGAIDLGFTPYDPVGPGQTPVAGTPVPTGLLVDAAITARTTFNVGGTGAGTYLGNVANATQVVVVTSEANSSASGSVSGFIKYFPVDPISGQQNV